ncbi:transcription initiation factor IIA subunit 2-like [Teleopsis dalmanni]|uniref:transcription initiation factor IIA subunit 2-like n=1 Tax=Teleopsis dalmanni TaxID=139649 RepID=UPI0018CDA415|nr:transcription initiation factor IIA subunit 2-like [Teleopsis dalmanni]
MSYQLYRSTTLGCILQETLDEQLNSGKIRAPLALKVMDQFDKSMSKVLNERIKAKCTFKAGKLDTYRFCDNVWSLFLKDVEIRDRENSIKVDNVKIIACEAKRRKLCEWDGEIH